MLRVFSLTRSVTKEVFNYNVLTKTLVIVENFLIKNSKHNNFLLNIPDAGKDRGQKEPGATEDEMVDGIINTVDMSLRKLWETVKDREAWQAVVHEITESDTT